MRKNIEPPMLEAFMRLASVAGILWFADEALRTDDFTHYLYAFGWIFGVLLVRILIAAVLVCFKMRAENRISDLGGSD